MIEYNESQPIVEQKLTQKWGRTVAHYSLYSTSSRCGDHDTKDKRQRRDESGLFVLPTRPLMKISNLTSSTTSIVELL